jgi:hypothetical protein
MKTICFLVFLCALIFAGCEPRDIKSAEGSFRISVRVVGSCDTVYMVEEVSCLGGIEDNYYKTLADAKKRIVEIRAIRREEYEWKHQKEIGVIQ